MTAPRMRKIHPTLALVAIALAGCASAPPPYPGDLEARLALYASAAACCDDPAAFDYAVLPGAGTVDIVIGADSPTFDFQSGLSRFAAFRLPDGDGPFRVHVKSFFEGRQAPAGSVFYPVLAMMDDAFIVTRVSAIANLRLDQALATPGGESGLAVTAPFDQSYSRERYLIVFTPAALLGSPPPERREGDVLTTQTLEWMQRNDDRFVAPSPFGRLRITVAPESVAGPG